MGLRGDGPILSEWGGLMALLWFVILLVLVECAFCAAYGAWWLLAALLACAMFLVWVALGAEKF